MKLLDANVIIYAVGRPHAYKEMSRRVTERMLAGEIEANINTEVLQEVLHYFHRVRQTQAALDAFDDLASMFPQPIPIDVTTAQLARDLLGRYPFLQVRDAFHAAVVRQHRLEGIISADRAFDRVVGLKRFDPKELAA